MEKEKEQRRAVGGQALFEGIMMRGKSRAAMAVRKKDGEIHLEEWDIKTDKWYQKAPFIRGVFNFVIQMKDGYKYMLKSAEISGMMDDEGEELSGFEEWLMKKFGDKLSAVIMSVGAFIGIALALLLFMFIPTWIVSGIQAAARSVGDYDIQVYRSLIEGVVKIVIFVLYLWGTSKMADIKRTYEYHGAEHKTIATYEAKQELTVENVRKNTRFHRRCGTSFIFLTLAVSILVYSIMPINSEFFVEHLGVGAFVADFLRVIAKILLMPLLVCLSYEVIRVAGRHDNILTRIVSAPGLAIQRLTTKEPDDKQIEIAIAAVMPVVAVDS